MTSSPDKEKSIPRGGVCDIFTRQGEVNTTGGGSVTSSPDKEKSIPRGGVCDIFTRQGEVNTTGRGL